MDTYRRNAFMEGMVVIARGFLLVGIVLAVATLAGPAEAIQLSSFTMTATPPGYTGPDLRDPDFTNCNFENFMDFPVPDPNGPNGVNVHDDQNAVLRSVRDDLWWRNSLMTLSGNLGEEIANRGAVHWHDGQGGFPEILSFFEDGGWRPLMALDRPYTSTVRIGPLQFNEERGRRYADVGGIDMLPDGQSIRITYESGGDATITILEATPSISRFRVDLNFDTPPDGNIFEVTSMYRDALVNDAALIRTIDSEGNVQKSPVLEYAGGDVQQISFLREEFSQHNSLGPDLVLSDFVFVDEQGETVAGTLHASNESFETDCAEVDNVVVSFSARPVPEPNGWALLAAGVAVVAVAGWVRRARRNASGLR